MLGNGDRPAPTQQPRSIDDLPVFTEIDAPTFGLDFDSLTEDLFSRDYQGLLRTSEGNYTDGSVFVYRNADIKSLVAHPDLSNQPIEVYSGPYAPHSEIVPSGFEQLMRNSLFTMQPPAHGTARQLVTRQLTIKSVARFTEPVMALVNDLIHEAVERDEIDFRHDFSDRVMSGFWRIALGWTQAEADDICALAATSQLSNLLNPNDDQRRAVNDASLGLLRRLESVLRRQLDAGTEDLLIDLEAEYLAMASDTPGRPSVLESMFGAALLDGLHSLGGVIASVVYSLIRTPDALAAVRADPALVPAAFREGVRLHPAVTFTQRSAMRDMEIQGVEVPAGTPVSLAWLLGNRDPAAFDSPNAYRLERPQGPQTTFGGGLYICPGRNVVRFLSEIVLRALTAPAVEIHATGPAPWVPMTGLHELEHMPVSIRLLRP